MGDRGSSSSLSPNSNNFNNTGFNGNNIFLNKNLPSPARSNNNAIGYTSAVSYKNSTAGSNCFQSSEKPPSFRPNIFEQMNNNSNQPTDLTTQSDRHTPSANNSNIQGQTQSSDGQGQKRSRYPSGGNNGGSELAQELESDEDSPDRAQLLASRNNKKIRTTSQPINGTSTNEKPSPQNSSTTWDRLGISTTANSSSTGSSSSNSGGVNVHHAYAVAGPSPNNARPLSLIAATATRSKAQMNSPSLPPSEFRNRTAVPPPLLPDSLLPQPLATANFQSFIRTNYQLPENAFVQSAEAPAPADDGENSNSSTNAINLKPPSNVPLDTRAIADDVNHMLRVLNMNAHDLAQCIGCPVRGVFGALRRADKAWTQLTNYKRHVFTQLVAWLHNVRSIRNEGGADVELDDQNEPGEIVETNIFAEKSNKVEQDEHVVAQAEPLVKPTVTESGKDAILVEEEEEESSEPLSPANLEESCYKIERVEQSELFDRFVNSMGQQQNSNENPPPVSELNAALSEKSPTADQEAIEEAASSNDRPQNFSLPNKSRQNDTSPGPPRPSVPVETMSPINPAFSSPSSTKSSPSPPLAIEVASPSAGRASNKEISPAKDPSPPPPRRDQLQRPPSDNDMDTKANAVNFDESDDEEDERAYSESMAALMTFSARHAQAQHQQAAGSHFAANKPPLAGSQPFPPMMDQQRTGPANTVLSVPGHKNAQSPGPGPGMISASFLGSIMSGNGGRAPNNGGGNNAQLAPTNIPVPAGNINDPNLPSAKDFMNMKRSMEKSIEQMRQQYQSKQVKGNSSNQTTANKGSPPTLGGRMGVTGPSSIQTQQQFPAMQREQPPVPRMPIPPPSSMPQQRPLPIPQQQRSPNHPQLQRIGNVVVPTPVVPSAFRPMGGQGSLISPGSIPRPTGPLGPSGFVNPPPGTQMVRSPQGSPVAQIPRRDSTINNSRNPAAIAQPPQAVMPPHQQPHIQQQTHQQIIESSNVDSMMMLMMSRQQQQQATQQGGTPSSASSNNGDSNASNSNRPLATKCKGYLLFVQNINVNDQRARGGLAATLPPQQLFVGANLSIAHGKRYGLIGPSECGTSLLLKFISRDPSFASILPPNQIVYCDMTSTLVTANSPFDCYFDDIDAELVSRMETSQQTAIEFVIEYERRWRELKSEEAYLEVSMRNGDAASTKEAFYLLRKVYEKLCFLGSGESETKARHLLDGLGFSPEMQRVPFSRLSPRSRKVCCLAQALYAEPALLLIDQPTQLLSVDSIMWLEAYLQNWPNSLIFTTHDRSFLDNVSSVIIYVYDKKLFYYQGNYSSFKQRLARQ